MNHSTPCIPRVPQCHWQHLTPSPGSAGMPRVLGGFGRDLAILLVLPPYLRVNPRVLSPTATPSAAKLFCKDAPAPVPH